MPTDPTDRHYLPAGFDNRTINVLLVGCGGNGGQMLIPILLVMALALGARHRVTILTAIVALIMTFAGHGSYALGYWPTPGNFYAMTTLILGVEYPAAQNLLRVAGILDFMVCILVTIQAEQIRIHIRLRHHNLLIWGHIASQ